MLRIFQHLLPRSLAWRTTIDTTLRRFFIGLSGLPSDVRAFIDNVLLDAFPQSTRELATWEEQFSLGKGGSDEDRRLKLATAWSAQGRQSPDAIQTILHAAGFDVYVHEYWVSTNPFLARDPRDYTTQPLAGEYCCESSAPWECFDPQPGEALAPYCDVTLQNDPHYFTTLDLTRRAPPNVPDDPARFPFFIYFSGAVFPEPAIVNLSRVTELRELIARISPVQHWRVLLIDPHDETEGFGTGDFGSMPLGA